MASSMLLPRAGQEYARLDFTGLPVGVVVRASIDGSTWRATEAGDTAQQRRILLRGPDCTDTDGILIVARTPIWVLVDDDPEVVIRKAGEVGLL